MKKTILGVWKNKIGILSSWAFWLHRVDKINICRGILNTCKETTVNRPLKWIYWSLLKFLDLVGVSFRKLHGSWILTSALGKRWDLRARKEEKGTLDRVGEIMPGICSAPLLSLLVHMANWHSSCCKVLFTKWIVKGGVRVQLTYIHMLKVKPVLIYWHVI